MSYISLHNGKVTFSSCGSASYLDTGAILVELVLTDATTVHGVSSPGLHVVRVFSFELSNGGVSWMVNVVF